MKRTRLRRRSLTVSAGAAVALLAGFLSGGQPAASAAAPAQPAARTVTFSVAPDGHGSACSPHDPCALTTARAEVRAANRGAPADIDVVLAGGTYRLDRTLALDAAKGDGGQAGHRVSYRAAPGAHPVLSGGEQVTGWQQGADGIWQAKVPAGTDTRQLYVDGVRAVRAQGADPTGFTRTPTGYTTSDTTLDGWKDITDVQFAYTVGWTEIYCGVASVSGTTVTMDQPCFDNSTRKPYGVNADLPDHVENAGELLDDPGEWYLDKSAHTLYYKPRPGQDLASADVEIPRLQTLVSGTGTQARPLAGLSFDGISFEYAGWTQPNGPDGFSEVQANMHLTGDDAWQKQGSCDRYSTTDPGTCPYGNWTMTPGNVVFDHTQGLAVTGSTFAHLGAAGLQLGRDVDGSTLEGNRFTDISGNGLEIGNGADAAPTDLALLPARNTVADNWVHDVAVEYTGGVGIFQSYTRDDVIEHNQVDDVPYSGISSNWGWGHTPTRTSGNRIVDNLVFDAMQLRSDGGGIYVLGQEGDSLADGMLISGNVVRDDNGANGGHAIYTDGGSTNITMTGNAMFADGTFSMGGCKEDALPYGNFSFTGNYVENTTPDWPCGNPDHLTLDNTQVASDGTGVPASLLAHAGLEPQYAHLAAAPAGTAPKDLAQGRPATARFVDGSWQSTVDLGRARTLGAATADLPRSGFATAFHLDASTDGRTWRTVGTVHDTNPGTVPVEFAPPVTARYLRAVADGSAAPQQPAGPSALGALGAYAPVRGGADLALHAPAQALFIDGTQADMQPGSLPSYATDGDPATDAQATGQYRWVQQVDLRRPRSVDLVTVLQPDDKFATDFHLEVSGDGSTWYTVARQTGSAGGLTGVRLARPATARYLRLVVDRPNQGGQSGGQMAVSELGAYGFTSG